MSNLEPTELVLAIAARRREGRKAVTPRTEQRAATPNGLSFSKRTCFALFAVNALIYLGTFGALAALPWAAVAFVIYRVPA